MFIVLLLLAFVPEVRQHMVPYIAGIMYLGPDPVGAGSFFSSCGSQNNFRRSGYRKCSGSHRYYVKSRQIMFISDDTHPRCSAVTVPVPYMLVITLRAY